MSDLPEFILNRMFDAPRELVWRAWTDPDLLPRWYGPGAETIIHKFDLKPGGSWLNEMKWGGNSDYSKMVFKEVMKPEKLVWHHYSTDSDWNNVASRMKKDWPKAMLTTVIFEDKGDKTNVRLTWVPFEATEAEIACFIASMSFMGTGWGSGYALMDELLAELKTEKK